MTIDRDVGPRLILLSAWADQNGISRRTAYYWAGARKVPGVRIGARWFVDLDELRTQVSAQHLAAARGVQPNKTETAAGQGHAAVPVSTDKVETHLQRGGALTSPR